MRQDRFFSFPLKPYSLSTPPNTPFFLGLETHQNLPGSLAELAREEGHLYLSHSSLGDWRGRASCRGVGGAARAKSPEPSKRCAEAGCRVGASSADSRGTGDVREGSTRDSNPADELRDCG